jgi:hypothetical protein
MMILMDLMLCSDYPVRTHVVACCVIDIHQSRLVKSSVGVGVDVLWAASALMLGEALCDMRRRVLNKANGKDKHWSA